MDQLIITGRAFGENEVFPLLTRFFEHKDIENTIKDTANILLNSDMAADWVKNCDAIYLKYTTQSVPSGLDVSSTFTVYQYNPSNCISISDAMDRVAHSDLSAFSNIVYTIACIFDYNAMHCKYLDMFFNNEGNQEGRYTITIANRGKELYKGGLNSGADFNNATKYITKSIIHEALEKFRVFPYKDIHVTVEDNALKSSYTFCVCGKTNIDNISEYSAIKTNIRFINFMNSSIKYDDKDAVAKSMVTRFCAIVMQIAAAIENNYGKSAKNSEEDQDAIRIVCEAYDEEKSFEAIYNAETGKFIRYINIPSRSKIEYTMKSIMALYPELISMSIHPGPSNYADFGFVVFDKSKNIGIGDSIKRSSGHAIEYIDRDKEKREFSTAVRNITREAVNYFLCLYGNEGSDYYNEYHDQIESLTNPEGIVMFKLYNSLGNATDGAVIPGEKFFRVLKADEHGYKNTLSPYLWKEYNPCDIIKDYYRAELYVPGSDVRPFALWHYVKLKESGLYETAELMIISAYDRIESFCKYMYLMNDSQIEYMQDSVVRIMNIISGSAFGNKSYFDKNEFSILGNAATKEAMRFINKEPGLCMSDNEDEGTGFNSLSLAIDDGISPYSQYLVGKGTGTPLEGTGYLINIEAYDWTHTFVNSNSAKIVVVRYDGYKMPNLVLWDRYCNIDRCIWEACDYIEKNGSGMTLAMKYNLIVVVRKILCQFILRSRKQAHEYCSGAYNQIKNSIEHTLGVKLENL